MRQLNILPKVLFIISLMILALFYGLLASKKGWFPSGQMDLALNQAESLKRAMKASTVYTAPSDDMNPKVYDRWGASILIPDNLQPGNTLITSLWDWNNSGEIEAGAKLINKEGQILHEWILNRNELFPNSKSLWGYDPDESTIHGSYLFSNGDLLFNIERVGTVRVDSCGEVIWRLPEFTHHSISRAEDGTFWIPDFSKNPQVGSKYYPDGFPGFNGKPVVANLILHINDNGQILNKINIFDILYKNNLQRYIPKVWGYNAFSHRIDLTHLNDIEPLNPSMADEYPLFEAGDLLVSLRNLNLVFVFDPETLEAKWHASEPFNHQHDPDFIGNGWIGVYDNNRNFTKRNKMFGGSRIVALEPHTGTVKILFPTKYSEPFYSFQMGKWQLLDNGNFLLTESLAGRVVEVAPDGQSVWEWIRKPFDRFKVPDLAKGHRYNLTKKDVASWDCSLVKNSKNFNK